VARILPFNNNRIRIRIITRDDVVSQRLGFGRWNFFICVTNAHVFLTFPFPAPLARDSRDVPKNCAILLAVTSNHVQVRLGDNVQQHCTRPSTKLLLHVCHACRVNIHSIDCDEKIMQEYSTHHEIFPASAALSYRVFSLFKRFLRGRLHEAGWPG